MSDPVVISVFQAWHCDHFGHVNTRVYAGLFDDAITAFWSQKGAALTGVVPVTAQMLTQFQSEAMPGTAVRIHATVQRLGGKSVTLDFAMTDLSGRAIACCEVVEVFFDLATRQSAPIPSDLRLAITPNAALPLSEPTDATF